jgi:hypothetical protein
VRRTKKNWRFISGKKGQHLSTPEIARSPVSKKWFTCNPVVNHFFETGDLAISGVDKCCPLLV